MVSGKKVDKAALFRTFYGDLKTAPLIEECPVGIECRLAQTVEFPTHAIFVGEVVGVYANDDCLTNGKIDIKKVDPIILTMPDNNYRIMGESVAQAWSAGKRLMKE